MSLQDVLTSAGAATVKTAEGAKPMVSARYPTNLIWAVVVRASEIIEGAVIYPGRDPNGNQIAFVSDRPPGAKVPSGSPPAKQVVAFRQGAATFNGVEAIDGSTFTEGEIAAGQLMANDAKMLDLSEADVKALQKIVKDEDAATTS